MSTYAYGITIIHNSFEYEGKIRDAYTRAVLAKEGIEFLTLGVDINQVGSGPTEDAAILDLKECLQIRFELMAANPEESEMNGGPESLRKMYRQFESANQSHSTKTAKDFAPRKSLELAFV